MEEYLETSYDKFVFRVKIDCFFSREDFWASMSGNVATVGISDFLQKTKGDVAFIETVETGTMVAQGQEMGRIETIKATFGILSPVTGKVIEVNPEMESNAYLINEDPYESGWIYKIEVADFERDKINLLPSEGYQALMQEKIEKEMKKR